jgi:hypothetical protein
MRQSSTTRRRLLRGGAAVATCGTFASTAGCLDGFRPPSYRTWLPAPTATTPASASGFETMQPAVLVERQDQFSADLTFDEMDRVWAPAPIEAGDASRFLHQNNVVVVEGSFDRDATRAAFEADGFEPRGTYDGYSLLTAPGKGAGAAIGDDDFVGVGLFMAAVDSPRPYLEAYVDANAGRVERFVDATDDLAALLDALDDPHYLNAAMVDARTVHQPEDGLFRGVGGRGHGWSVAERTVTARWAFPFKSTDAVDVEALRTWVDANRGPGRQFADWRDVTVDTAETVGVVTARMDAQDY